MKSPPKKKRKRLLRSSIVANQRPISCKDSFSHGNRNSPKASNSGKNRSSNKSGIARTNTSLLWLSSLSVQFGSVGKYRRSTTIWGIEQMTPNLWRPGKLRLRTSTFNTCWQKIHSSQFQSKRNKISQEIMSIKKHRSNSTLKLISLRSYRWRRRS